MASKEIDQPMLSIDDIELEPKEDLFPKQFRY